MGGTFLRKPIEDSAVQFFNPRSVKGSESEVAATAGMDKPTFDIARWITEWNLDTANDQNGAARFLWFGSKE
jgi:hypothetical protein